MNRFKILKDSNSKPCYAPVVPEEIPPLSTRKITGFRGAVGYTGIIGTPPESSEAAMDLQAMHGIVVGRTGFGSLIR